MSKTPTQKRATAAGDTAVARQVTNGGGGMPSLGGHLSTAQIAAIATCVAKSAGH